jgi:hypothetical protein
MLAIVFTLLQSKDMFPPNSRCAKLLQSCYSDGYKALKTIMLEVHPAFHTYPSMLVKAYPMQENLTLQQYYGWFVDYQQLRAYVSNITLSLDDESELDIFLLHSLSCQRHFGFTPIYNCQGSYISRGGEGSTFLSYWL